MADFSDEDKPAAKQTFTGNSGECCVGKDRRVRDLELENA